MDRLSHPRRGLVFVAMALIFSLPAILAPADHPVLVMVHYALPVGLLLAAVLVWRLRPDEEMSEQRAWRNVWVVAAVFAVMMLLLAWLQVRYMQGFSVDTGIFLNSLHNTTQGRFFFNIHEVGSHFHMHNSVILLFLYPLHLVFPGHWMLISVVIVCIAVAIPFAYKLAREWLAPGPSLCLAAAFALHPTVISQALPDFHEMNLAVLPMVLVLYYFVRRRYGLFILWLLMLLFVKESLALTGVALAVAGLVQRRKWTWWVVPGVISIAWALFSLKVVMPYFASDEQAFIVRRLFGQETLGGAIAYMITHPAAVVAEIGVKELAHVYLCALPWGVVPILTTLWPLILLPHMALLLLMENQFAMWLWDPAIIGPVLMVAAAAGIAKIGRRWFADEETRRAAVAQIAVIIVILSAALCGATSARIDLHKPERYEEIKQAARLIPDDVSLTVTSYLSGFFYKRHILRHAPWWLPHKPTDGYPHDSDYIFVVWTDDVDQIAEAGEDERFVAWDEFLADLRAGKQPHGYHPLFMENDVYVAKREGAATANP